MSVTDLDTSMLTYTRDWDVGLLTLSSPTTRIAADSSAGTATVSIGFNFRFDGTTYNSYFVMPFGWIRFSGTTTSSTNSTLFASDSNVLVAPWFDSMKTATTTGYVRTETQGTAPYRRHVVEWRCFMQSGHTSVNNDTITFQCVLYETLDRIEFRYGPRVRTGSPSAASASIGVKGVTSSVTTNYRDCWGSGLALGGGNTSNTGLTAGIYDGLANLYAFVIEPAYPMCGRYIPLENELIVGQISDNAEPFRSWANNVNWHYCRHSPPLLNWITECHNGLYPPVGASTIVAPIEPSGDGLRYDFRFLTRNNTSANLTLEVRESALAAPRWDVDADWTVVYSENKTSVSGVQEWGPGDYTVLAASKWLRFKLTPSAGSAVIESGMVAPAAITTPPTSTTAIGWTRMGLGMLLSLPNMPVGPEPLNRMWKNTALVLADRKQCVASVIRPIGSTHDIDPLAGVPLRPLNWLPLSMSNQSGSVIRLRGYIRSMGGTGKVHLRLQSGNALTWTIPNSTTFSAYSGTLTLTAENPVISFTYEPPAGGTMEVGSIVAHWTPGE